VAPVKNSEAAEAFEETLNDLGVEVPREAAVRSAILAASDAVWAQGLERLLARAEVQTLMNVGTRQGIADHVSRQRLLALPDRDGQRLFPAFQFGEDGRPLPGLGEVLRALHGAFESPYSLASWFVTGQEELAGETPAVMLRAGELEAVMLAAARTRERLIR
jgi:hypothetical protein